MSEIPPPVFVPADNEMRILALTALDKLQDSHFKTIGAQTIPDVFSRIDPATLPPIDEAITSLYNETADVFISLRTAFSEGRVVVSFDTLTGVSHGVSQNLGQVALQQLSHVDIFNLDVTTSAGKNQSYRLVTAASSTLRSDTQATELAYPPTDGRRVAVAGKVTSILQSRKRLVLAEQVAIAMINDEPYATMVNLPDNFPKQPNMAYQVLAGRASHVQSFSGRLRQSKRELALPNNVRSVDDDWQIDCTHEAAQEIVTAIGNVTKLAAEAAHTLR